jgi:hypothetical protein
MKVKYADQVAFSTVTPTMAGAGAEFDSLADDFPTLDSNDAILLKRVVLNMDIESPDVKKNAA